MIWFIVPIALCILIVAFAVKLIRTERGEGDDPWNWRGWDGPKDWPKLPLGPKGPSAPDYVPDEWVWEELGQPPRILKPIPSKGDIQ